MGTVGDVGRLEHLRSMVVGLDAHVLLAERLCVLLDVCVFLRAVRSCRHCKAAVLGTYQLLRERHLLELHLVDAGNGGRGQRTRGEEDSRLHDGSERCVGMGKCTRRMQVEWMMGESDGRAAVT